MNYNKFNLIFALDDTEALTSINSTQNYCFEIRIFNYEIRILNYETIFYGKNLLKLFGSWVEVLLAIR